MASADQETASDQGRCESHRACAPTASMTRNRGRLTDALPFETSQMAAADLGSIIADPGPAGAGRFTPGS